MEEELEEKQTKLPSQPENSCNSAGEGAQARELDIEQTVSEEEETEEQGEINDEPRELPSRPKPSPPSKKHEPRRSSVSSISSSPSGRKHRRKESLSTRNESRRLSSRGTA